MRLLDFRTHFVLSKVKCLYVNHLRGLLVLFLFRIFSTRFVMATEIAVTAKISFQRFYFDSRTLRKFLFAGGWVLLFIYFYYMCTAHTSGIASLETLWYLYFVFHNFIFHFFFQVSRANGR